MILFCLLLQTFSLVSLDLSLTLVFRILCPHESPVFCEIIIWLRWWVLSLAPNSNSILLSHILRFLNQNGLGFRTRRTQIAEIQFFSILLFLILFSASLVLIISLILFMTHFIYLFQLKLLNFYFSNKFILSFFFVHLQFESFHTERKTENSFITPCHFIVAHFHQKWLLPYALGRGSSLVKFLQWRAHSFPNGTCRRLARKHA